MLIATLPAVHREQLLETIISHPSVDWVRYNTGIESAYSADETLSRIYALTQHHGKKLSIDIKGRQLRIVQWAAPNYGKIILNHAITVSCPTKIFFRGNEWSEIKVVRDNTIYVDPPPRRAVGAGQAVNIHGSDLMIDGYLTHSDIEYIHAAARLGITSFMLSFAEQYSDIMDVAHILQNEHNITTGAEYILKIESQKGIAFINSMSRSELSYLTLMAARDDLMINIGKDLATVLPVLAQISKHNDKAIVASRIFAGLEQTQQVTMADLSDIHLMHMFGYKNFMLSDGVCNNCFIEAITTWQQYKKMYDHLHMTKEKK